MFKKAILVAFAAVGFGSMANAQVNLQTFYDFGKDRQYLTTTFEMFKPDKFGDTFFFIDHYYNPFNKNFSQVFTDLFGGGTAEIILGNDSEDVLECAIDIKAQPPGKKLQNLSLLSGGERCLTAIGLLFAIQELKPSPFVILDEVEAALDDVNITRFTDFVRRHSSKSQFILVTHRKGTMEACDQMYGVTMAERGVSKILSMELK